MIGWNSIAKNVKIFLNAMQQFRMKIPYRFKKNENISFNCDINDHVYSKLKSSNFERIWSIFTLADFGLVFNYEVKWILIWSIHG